MSDSALKSAAVAQLCSGHSKRLPNGLCGQL